MRDVGVYHWSGAPRGVQMTKDVSTSGNAPYASSNNQYNAFMNF